MKLTLNGRQLDGFLSEQATLGTALNSLQEQQVGPDEVIAAVYVDGEPLTAEQLAQWKNRPVSEFDETIVEAQNRNTMAANGLRIVAQNLADSHAVREIICEHLCQGRPGEAMNLLPQYLETWSVAQQSLGSASRLLEIDLEHLQAPSQLDSTTTTATDQIHHLAVQLGQVKAALEAGDLVLLADILDYEFGDLADKWQQMLLDWANLFEQHANPS